MAAKLDIKRELDNVDRKNYNFYDNLSEEEKKAFSPYVLMRYTSNVDGNQDLQEWFVEKTNETVNKDHWTLSKNHKALLWKLFSVTGIGNTFKHQYIASSKKEKTAKIGKLLAELYPTMKLEDINIWVGLLTKEDKDELFDKLGFDKKQRKEYE